MCAALHNLPEWGIIGHLLVTKPKARARSPNTMEAQAGLGASLFGMHRAVMHGSVLYHGSDRA